MATNKFSEIHAVLRREILQGVYNDVMLLPTELELVERFKASRNTVRRAIAQMNDEGLTYSVKGRGVVILESSRVDKVYFKPGNFQGLKELISYNDVDVATRLIGFEELTVSEELAREISFHEHERVYRIRRLRMIDGRAMMYDTSYFRKSIIGAIDEGQAQESIYSFVEHNANFNIAASKSVMKIVSADDEDLDLLDLGAANCVGEIENIVYTDLGKLFEHTFIRYIPNEYVMVSFSHR